MYNVPQWKQFTFQYGRLKTVIEVEVKLLRVSVFTFQYGRLKTTMMIHNAWTSTRFTFQYGRLKTENSVSKHCVPFIFTFQYGRLKTVAFKYFIFNLIYLHSNMVD